MGITYDSLRAIKPDVVLVMISAFGPDGPYAHRVGFDTVAQAMSGAMGLTGFPGPPTRALVPFEDFGTALHAAFGAMVALYHRRETGHGQLVDASLLASGVAFMQSFLAERYVTGRERRQQGNAGFHSAPSDCYPVKDGWIVVAVIGDAMFGRWARLVGREDLLQDARFQDDVSRADQYELVAEIMTAWTSGRTAAEALAELEPARIPSGPVHSLEQTLCDPQVRARELLRYVPHPGAAKDVPLANTPVRLSSTPGGIRRRAPAAGEHTDEILGELGFSADEIAAFRRLEIV